MMAFVGAGREAEARRRCSSAQAAALEGPGDNANFAREVGPAGGPGAPGLRRGRLRRRGGAAARRAQPRPRFGGSHAQRDVIDLTLIAAARRGGRKALEAALLAERETAKPRIEGERIPRAA